MFYSVERRIQIIKMRELQFVVVIKLFGTSEVCKMKQILDVNIK